MIINIRTYLLDYIGNTSWHGESNYDDISSRNLDKLDDALNEIEDLREELLCKLAEHVTYRKGNASAEHLHKKAKSIMKKHIIKEFTHTDFEQYWESGEK